MAWLFLRNATSCTSARALAEMDNYVWLIEQGGDK